MGKVDLTFFPVNTATCCICARDCIWVSLQMSRSVETCIRGCQNYSSPNTQEILHILIGSLLEHEQSGELVILRDEEQIADESLTDGE